MAAPFDGISEAYRELCRADSFYLQNIRKPRIEQALNNLEARVDFQRDKLIQEEAINPALSKTWQDYAGLVTQVAPAKFKQKFQKIQTEIFQAATDKRVQACQKHQLDPAVFEAFMRQFEGQDATSAPVFKAVETNEVEILKVLKELGAEIDQPDRNGLTPLMHAMQRQQLGMQQLLKKLGAADIDQPDSEGRTPLIRAVMAGQADRVRLLHDFGASLVLVDKEGLSALQHAIKQNRPKMIELLAELGVNINDSASLETLPLLQAVKAGQTALVEVFKKLGVVDKPDSTGQTPLIRAVREGRADLVQLLHQLGANLNVFSEPDMAEKAGVLRIKTEWTALDFALNRNDFKMVNLLIKLGADINKPNSRGLNAMTRAMLVNDMGRINLLESLGAKREYAEEFLRRKFLAHVWGIGGNSMWVDKLEAHDQVFELESFSDLIPLSKLSKYVHQFFAEYEVESLSAENRLAIRQAMASAYPLVKKSDAEIVADIKAGQPVVIQCGSSDHAISLVFCKDQLIVCNRGKGSRENTSEFFALPADRVTEEMIKKFKIIYPSITNFYSMLDSLHLTPAKGFSQRKQRVGNCTLVNTQAAFGVLCRLFTDDVIGKKTYKDFKAFMRDKALQEYLEESPVYDLGLIEAIKQKCDRKPGLELSKELLRQHAARFSLDVED